ncbi:MAG TPA: hypothetical protein VFL04_09005 [Rectinemataceae bacterium]|nr:hypothetical protein [Rectinemataceae bacterium]
MAALRARPRAVAPEWRRLALGGPILRSLLAISLSFALLGGIQAQAKPDALKLYLDGKYEDSRRACLDELSADPANLEAYVVISWSLLALERWADAENYALKGYDLRRDARLTEALGEAAYHLGRNEAALRNFQNYVSVVQ